MNQEKIGKFIQELRKEQNLTQKDLAEKLGVSINAVSKWERGICLMDISLLKPLSKCLKVSITEIINGERLAEDNVKVKAEEAIESTIKYSNKRIKKAKKKNRIVLLITILVVLLCCFFTYKGIALYVYSAEPLEEQFLSFVDGLNNQDKMTITYKPVIEEDYLVYEEMKIRNDFVSYIKKEGTEEEYNSLIYYLNDENGKLKSSFWYGKSNTYLDLFSSQSIIVFGVDNSKVTNSFLNDENLFNSSDRNEFLVKNNINNDIDFLNFIKDNYYLKNNIFTSVEDMKQNYAYNIFVNIMATSFSKITIIEGKYDGYIFNYDYEIPVKEVNILKNNKRYVFTFIGKEFTDNYIKDVLDTLVIE